jgi:WhiB family redox-sensing transcriptional regulator
MTEYWRESAACRHADPEIFFPIGTCGPAMAEIDRARRICAGCPRTDALPGLGADTRRCLRHLGRPDRARTARRRAPGASGRKHR